MRAFVILMAAGALMATSAAAQTAVTSTKTTVKTAGQPAKTTTTTAKGAPAKARSEISLACSAQADSKGLHKKDREKFMRSCKKGKPAA